MHCPKDFGYEGCLEKDSMLKTAGVAGPASMVPNGSALKRIDAICKGSAEKEVYLCTFFTGYWFTYPEMSPASEGGIPRGVSG